MSSRARQQPFEQRSEPGTLRRVQWLFWAYHLLVSSLLAFIFFFPDFPTQLGQYHPILFGWSIVFYLGAALTEGGLLAYYRALPVAIHTLLGLLIDTAVVLLLMHASGGIQSGLGMLLAVTIAFISLLMPGVTALLAAALASLGILAQELYATLLEPWIPTTYPQAGLLGASFFAIAILSHVPSRRIKERERLISQRELDLANLEQLNEYIIRNMQTGILVVDDLHTIRLMNESAWHLLGMPGAKPGNPLSQASAQLADLLSEWSDDPTFTSTPFCPLPNGREIKPGFSRLGIETSQGAVIFLEDVTAVTQQAQQMKLASLGRLTASIAHEIRNPLGAISHAGQLLQESQGIVAGDRRLLDIIETHTKRVNSIIESVLQLSRRGRAHPVEINMKEWVAHFVREFRDAKSLSLDTLSTRIQPESTVVRVDNTQLHQIVSNLCENALLHAEPSHGPLRIHLTGGITRETGGPYLDIIDNGPGIAPEALRHIYEPFFTTDSAGSGLGRYIAKELAETNRMRLEYIQEPGAGAHFRIGFPSYRILKAR
ncbi:MAG: histidine kinase [gamma proteobacterium symbiont of Phacoides pectinatus]